MGNEGPTSDVVKHSQSQRGSRFVEGMLSIASSCRAEARNLLIVLVEVCQAVLSRTPVPFLVPQNSTSGYLGDLNAYDFIIP